MFWEGRLLPLALAESCRTRERGEGEKGRGKEEMGNVFGTHMETKKLQNPVLFVYEIDLIHLCFG